MAFSRCSRLGGAALVVMSALWVGSAEAQIEPQPHRDDVERRAAEEEAAAEPVLTRAPELSVYVDPDYPPEVVEAGVEGEVVLLITICAEGTVTDAEVVDSPDRRLSDAALEAARKLEFIPAEIDHSPAPVRIEFGYYFSLEAHVVDEPQPKADEPEPKADVPEPKADEPEPKADVPEPKADVPEPKADERDPKADERDPEEEIAEPAHPVTLSGRALARGLREPIDGAMVVSGDEAATTDAEGYFELRLEPGRSHEVAVRAPGFHPFETSEHIEPGERHEVVYYVQRHGPSPYETVVRARRPRKEVSRIVVPREESRRVPGAFGDPLRVVESLPGMARAPFIGGQLLVRGARPEDSGVYFDGTEIPLLYHFGGLTSVVNAEFIEEIDFMPGGFGAEHGRATAGIVDVAPRRLIGEPARGSAKIDLMDTSLFYRLPVNEDLAVGLAVRRSYVDLLLPPILNAAARASGTERVTLAPVYGDYQLKLDWNPSEHHELDVFLFGSRDTLELLTAGSAQAHGLGVDMSIAFHRLLLTHRWSLLPNLALRTRPVIGLTMGGGGGGEVDGQVHGEGDLDLLEVGLRQDLSWKASESLTVRTGLDFLAMLGWGRVDAPIPSDLLAFPSPMQPVPESQVFEEFSGGAGTALWAEAIAEPGDRLQLVPGLRLELYRFPQAWRPVVEPRLSARYGLLEGTTLKAAGGIYHQHPTIFEINEVIGNPRLHPERARHLVVGLEQDIGEVFDLDFQLFHNRYTDLVVGASGTNIEDGQTTGETFINRGDGQAYGMEVLLRHKLTPRAFGWLAYTLMRSERRSRPENEYVITGYDQTHILTLVGSYRIGQAFELGARFRLVTGNPYTPVIDSTHDMDTDRWRPVHGPTRSARLPTFHQLDLRAEYTHTFDTFQISAFLDLLNSYNQRNVESFQYDYRYRERVDFHGLPIFPVLGARGQW